MRMKQHEGPWHPVRMPLAHRGRNLPLRARMDWKMQPRVAHTATLTRIGEQRVRTVILRVVVKRVLKEYRKGRRATGRAVELADS